MFFRVLNNNQRKGPYLLIRINTHIDGGNREVTCFCGERNSNLEKSPQHDPNSENGPPHSFSNLLFSVHTQQGELAQNCKRRLSVCRKKKEHFWFKKLPNQGMGAALSKCGSTLSVALSIRVEMHYQNFISAR